MWRRWAKAGMVGLVLAAFAWLVLRRHEPFYQGKPLSYWLEEANQLQAPEFESSEPTAKAALRSLGTNALPLLVEMAGTRASVPRLIVGDLARDADLSYLHLPPQEGKPEMAAWGFRLFGAEAKPAVPQLIRLLHSRFAWVQRDAATCLGAIGPAAEEAVPALVALYKQLRSDPHSDPYVLEAIIKAFGDVGPAARCAIPVLAGPSNGPVTELTLLKLKGESFVPFLDRLKDTSDPNKWCSLAVAAGELGTNAAPAIPCLLGLMQHTNNSIRQEAIRTLGKIHQQPELCVPALASVLGEKDDCTFVAVEALRRFGPAARPALPKLLPLLQRSDTWFNQQLTNALRDVAPETLSRPSSKTSTHDLPAAR